MFEILYVDSLSVGGGNQKEATVYTGEEGSRRE